MKVSKKPTVLLERFPYRYIQVGKLEINGMPDCRIQKVDSYTGRYRDMYLCDNEMQLLTAMEDHDYTCWLDPDGVPAYVKDTVSSLLMFETDAINLTFAHPWMTVSEANLLFEDAFERFKHMKRYSGWKTVQTLMNISYGIWQREPEEYVRVLLSHGWTLTALVGIPPKFPSS